MAGGTDQSDMLSRQRETRRGIMIKFPDFPTRYGMAFGTCGRDTERAEVMIINMTRLAGDALGGKCLIHVAFFTFDRRMLAQQREARQLMIEQAMVFPFDTIVTIGAFRAEIARMFIIILVTAHTSDRWQFDVGRLEVTCFAFHRLVSAGEGKARHRIMIEAGDLPILAIVAFAAFLAIVALMRIVFLMAAKARP